MRMGSAVTYVRTLNGARGLWLWNNPGLAIAAILGMNQHRTDSFISVTSSLTVVLAYLKQINT